MAEKDYAKPGHLQARCRRCGQTYMTYTKLPNVQQALMELALMGRTVHPEGPTHLGGPPRFVMERSIHDCPDGGTGIGDCIGGLIEEDLVEEKIRLPQKVNGHAH